jgi:regulator of RNase E activity RraB
LKVLGVEAAALDSFVIGDQIKQREELKSQKIDLILLFSINLV